MQNNQQQQFPLTEKDLAYIRDSMSWELLASKKAFQYAHQTLEPECRQLMYQVAQTHQQNMERLLNHLGQSANQPIQAGQFANMGVSTTTQQ